MCNGFAGSTTRFGSLFGNGSSQSSFVFAPPEDAVHSNAQPLFIPFAVPAGASDRFSPASPPVPGPTAWTLAVTKTAAPKARAKSTANRLLRISLPSRFRVSNRNVYRDGTKAPRRRPARFSAARAGVGCPLVPAESSWRNLSEMELRFKRSGRRALALRREPLRRSPLAWRSVRAGALALVLLALVAESARRATSTAQAPPPLKR